MKFSRDEIRRSMLLYAVTDRAWLKPGETLPQVAEAAVSHEAGTAVVTLTAELSDEALKKAVEDQDYTVTDIR